MVSTRLIKFFISCFSLFFFINSAPFAQKMTGSAQINAVLEQTEEFRSNRYDSTERAQYPLGFHTEDFFREEYEFNKKMLSELSQINTGSLSFDDFISWELLRFNLQNDIKLFEFKEYLIPIDSEGGFHTGLLYKTGLDLNSKESVEKYFLFLNDIPRYFDEQIVLMRRGIKTGIVPSIKAFQNFSITYEPHITEKAVKSKFFEPFISKPESFSKREWKKIREKGIEHIHRYVTPSYKKLKDFFENEYFPNMRNSIAISDLPGGKTYYDHKIQYYTTQKITPNQLHQIGRNEVKRIRREMKNVFENIFGFDGDIHEFFTYLRTDSVFYYNFETELLKEASYIAKKIDSRLPLLFNIFPSKPYGISPASAYRFQNSPSGWYSITSIDSVGLGIFYVNTTKLNSRPKYTLPALTLHEAVPGHHFQRALVKENDNIPDFRKTISVPAYTEGWALYAESLGHEMNIYDDNYYKFGRYTYEMWRACRLVIDTGIHYMGWSKEQAVNFLSENSALSMHEVNTEINRYITWPGQALAYKIGELTIKQLRDKAEKELGEKFDVREFHNVVLSKGTVTMRILEEIVDRYIKSAKSS